MELLLVICNRHTLILDLDYVSWWWMWKKTDKITRATAVQIIRFSQTSGGGLRWQCWGHSSPIVITLLDFWSRSCWTQSWSLPTWDGLLVLVWVDLVLLLVNLTWPTIGNASLLDKAFSLSWDPGQLTFLWLLPGKVPLQPRCPGLAGPERAQVSQASPSPSLHYIVFHQPACLTSQQSIPLSRNGWAPAVAAFCMDFPWTPINNQSLEESRPLLVSHGSIDSSVDAEWIFF